MEIIAEYSLPILAALLLIIFYLHLPDLQSCSLQRPGGHRLDRVDAALMAGISLVYACVAFWNLGDTRAPESFVNMEQRSATVELEESGARELMLYCGVGIGEYSIEFSADGENYSPLTTFTQTHGEVLKWNSVELEGGLPEGYLRISGTGNVWLGELVARDGDGNIIPASCNEAALTDEQELCPAEQTFMNSSYFDEIYHARTAWENPGHTDIRHDPLRLALLRHPLRGADAACHVCVFKEALRRQDGPGCGHHSLCRGLHALCPDPHRHHRYLCGLLYTADVSVHVPVIY